MRISTAVLAIALSLAACTRREGPPLETKHVPQEKIIPPFYYDLGPATVEVSGYPARQQENYRVFLAVCGACHTAARPLNAPYAEADVWKRYVHRMHVKMNGRGIELAGQDEERIVEFLGYDSKLRKADKRQEFEAQQKALKDLFDAMTKEAQTKAPRM